MGQYLEQASDTTSRSGRGASGFAADTLEGIGVGAALARGVARRQSWPATSEGVSDVSGTVTYTARSASVGASLLARSAG